MSHPVKHVVHNLEQLRQYAKALCGRLQPRQLILLNGPMGAGKTQLTKFILEELGSEETVSPSFALHNTYETTRGPVEHLDLFRTENEDEIESAGLWDLFSAQEGLIIIEWADRVPIGLWPRSWARIEIQIRTQADGSREILETRLV